MNPDNKACIAELRISVETRCRPDLDDIDSANILSVIEQLQSRVAELEAENAKLHEQVDLQVPKMAFTQLKEQLAAAQAYAEQLREVIDAWIGIAHNCAIESGVCCCGEAMQNHSSPMMCGHSPVDMADSVVHSAIKKTEKALALPHDTSALDAYVAEKVKELNDEHRRATLIRYEQTAEIIRQRDLAVDAVPTFVAEFARFVGGDGEFWLHELEDFLETWKKMQDYTIKGSEK